MNRDTWTRSHDLALVYVALAYGSDSELTDDELGAITDRLSNWRSDFTLDEVQVVVLEALAIFIEEDAEAEVRRSIRSLVQTLSHDEREQALRDIVHIAEADGIVLTAERSLIDLLARSWGLKALSDDLMEQSDSDVETVPYWSIVHDLSLIYLTMAHSTDNELSPPEIEAIVSRLRDWKRELTEQDIREIVRSTLALYAKGPDESLLHQSVGSIRDVLPMIQRLAVLDDLVHIAESDGRMNEHERTMLSSLARVWGLAVRLNGRGSAAGEK